MGEQGGVNKELFFSLSFSLDVITTEEDSDCVSSTSDPEHFQALFKCVFLGRQSYEHVDLPTAETSATL